MLVYLGLLGARLLAERRPLAAIVDEAMLIAVLLSLAALVYLWGNPLMRDLFREFPSPGGR